mmetsp:Transcript_123011/g.244833  ORF Transcript_123011/g.244833 Transcript_123011/m.244833 type:complete len:133 (-) Transcript_123011:5-403(-)
MCSQSTAMSVLTHLCIIALALAPASAERQQTVLKADRYFEKLETLLEKCCKDYDAVDCKPTVKDALSDPNLRAYIELKLQKEGDKDDLEKAQECYNTAEAASYFATDIIVPFLDDCCKSLGNVYDHADMFQQ